MKAVLSFLLFSALAQAAFGQAALRSVTAARELDQRKPASPATRPARRQQTAPAQAAQTGRAPTAGTDRMPTKPQDREAKRAAAMFSKALLAFNDREHGKRIMAQHAPSYRLEDWHYFPVRIKSLTSRKVEDKVIMVNPETGKFKLEAGTAR